MGDEMKAIDGPEPYVYIFPRNHCIINITGTATYTRD